MSRLSIFPHGIRMDVLSMATNAGRPLFERIFKRRAQPDLHNLLETLRRRGLVFSYGTGLGQTYSAHPFLRDYFARTFDVPSEKIYDTIQKELAVGLKERPGEYPTDESKLDRYERWIEATRQTGNASKALLIFLRTVGGYANLSRLGEFGRGARILASFDENTGMPPQARAELFMESALFAMHLGDLPQAERRLRSHQALSQALSPWEVAFGLQAMSRLYLYRGSLPEAVRIATIALSTAPIDVAQIGSTAVLGAALGLLGRIADARKCFTEFSRALAANAGSLRMMDDGDEEGEEILLRKKRGLFKDLLTSLGISAGPFWALGQLWEIDFLTRTGKRAVARRRLSDLNFGSDASALRHAALAQGMKGELVTKCNSLRSRAHLAEVRNWANRTGDVEITLCGYRLASRIAAADGDLVLAFREAQEGAALADVCEFGLHSIDFLLALGRLHHAAGEYEAAMDCVQASLARSRDPRCAYAWGEADALHLSGVLYTKLGDILSARRYLEDAVELRAKIEHPGERLSRYSLARICRKA